MKLTITLTSKYRKDVKTAAKRNYDLRLLEAVIDLLATGEPLPTVYHDHPLIGEYKGCRECHILPDWLLIYQIADSQLLLILTRTGTHSDLFP